MHQDWTVSLVGIASEASRLGGASAWGGGQFGFRALPILPSACPSVVRHCGWDNIAKRLGGAAGPDSVDAALAKSILTGYGRASAQLCDELVEWAQWLANESPPWAAYRAMTVRRLLGLDKEPGTRPVGIGCIWLRGICKLLLAETADEAKSACKATQLCAGLEAGIGVALRAC